jgi:hypothetical protein
MGGVKKLSAKKVFYIKKGREGLGVDVKVWWFGPFQSGTKRNEIPQGQDKQESERKNLFGRRERGGKIGYDTTLSGEGKKAGKESRDAMQMRRVYNLEVGR